MTDIRASIANDGEPSVIKLLHARARGHGVPLAVTFELTSRCNFQCKMCYIHGEDTPCGGELSASEWLSLGRQAFNAGALFLLITGGEPLIRSDFAEIYTGLSEMGFVISVNTNGSLLNDTTAELFGKYPPNRINVSLYGVDNGTYKSVTGKEAFDDVRNNILRLKAMGVDCRLNCVLNPLNGDACEGIFAFARENGLFVKATSYMYPPVRRGCFESGKCAFRFDPNETAFYRKEIQRLTLGEEKYRERCREITNNAAFFTDECDEADTGTPILCRAGTSSCWIDSGGFMSACGLFAVNKSDARNNGFASAWEDVRRTVSEIRLSPRCAACAKKPLCGVCAASAYAETGRFDGTPEFLCKTADRLYDYLKADTE